MADEEKVQDENIAAGGDQTTSAPEDLMAGILNQDNRKPGVSPWKFWLLLCLLPIVSVTVGYFAWHHGYREGKKTLYTKDLYAVRESSAHSDAIFPIERLQVNLADTDQPKYLMISLHLALDHDRGLSECANKEGVIRDGLITLLSLKKSWDILTPTAQNKLKRQMRDDINTSLKVAHVKELYIAEFKVRPIVASAVFEFHDDKEL